MKTAGVGHQFGRASKETGCKETLYSQSVFSVEERLEITHAWENMRALIPPPSQSTNWESRHQFQLFYFLGLLNQHEIRQLTSEIEREKKEENVKSGNAENLFLRL